MTENDYLLLCLAEECMEVSHRISKALRFGLDEHRTADPSKNNAQLISEEFTDLLAVKEMIDAKGLLPLSGTPLAIAAKKEKVKKYLKYSEACGQVYAPAGG